MRADKEKMVNLWLGKIIATLKGYTLENYPFDFTGDNFRRDKSGKTDAAWKLLNGIRTRGLSPRMLLRLILLSPTILLILVRLNINAFVTAYLTRNFYYTLPETKRRDFLMKNIWGGNPGKNWNRALETVYANRKEFRSPREKLINLIRSLDPELYDGVIELGTGNGWLLNRLSKKMARKRPLTGLDLNEHTILRARSKYKKNKSLRFLCSDLPRFAKRHTLKRTLLVTCFVLEYFSRSELRDLVSLLKSHTPCTLAILERVRKSDRKNQSSLSLGNFSYSHNYVEIFSKLGLQTMTSISRVSEVNPRERNLIAIFQAVP